MASVMKLVKNVILMVFVRRDVVVEKMKLVLIIVLIDRLAGLCLKLENASEGNP